MNFESEKSIDQVFPGDLEDLNFDDWKQLHERDPELFNYYRQQLLEYQISLAPEEMRPRLRGLLFQLEGEAIRSRSAMDYNQRLSNMMMAMVEQMRDQLLLVFQAPQLTSVMEKRPVPTAEVIPFRPAHKPPR